MKEGRRQFTQLIGSYWVWSLLVPEVSHRLPLIAGVGEGGEAHAAERGGESEAMTTKVVTITMTMTKYLASVAESLDEKASISSLVGQQDSPGWQ